MGKYSELINKLEDLGKADREIDLEILNALAPHESGLAWVWGAPLVPVARHSFAVVMYDNDLDAELSEKPGLQEAFDSFARKVPTVTESMTAIIKLCRERYPNAQISVDDFRNHGTARVCLVPDGEWTRSDATTSAMAICAAILKAKEVADAE